MDDQCLNIDASLGERIRYYRKKNGMTQKTLAEACGVSEPAIRNYELGNRVPDPETLDCIADALDVGFYALSAPVVNDLFGAMHALFRMEEIYGIHPAIQDGKVVLVVDGEQTSLLNSPISIWSAEYQKYQSGKISKEEYENWMSRYPKSVSEK